MSVEAIRERLDRHSANDGCDNPRCNCCQPRFTPGEMREVLEVLDRSEKALGNLLRVLDEQVLPGIGFFIFAVVGSRLWPDDPDMPWFRDVLSRDGLMVAAIFVLKRPQCVLHLLSGDQRK